jgi:hypothetical protein
MERDSKLNRSPPSPEYQLHELVFSRGGRGEGIKREGVGVGEREGDNDESGGTVNDPDFESSETNNETGSTGPREAAMPAAELIIRPDSAASNENLLAEDFTPGDDDVICGRGKKCYSHKGNKRFRERVILMLDEYKRAKSKLDKSNVLSRVVDQVRHQSPSGGFVKQSATTGRWFEVGDFLAREKTSQAFRDALHDRYKSSNLAKKQRRQEEQARASDTYNKLAVREEQLKRLEEEFLGQCK